MSDNNSTKIRKLFPDRSEYWGDGGGAAISYPVWIADTLTTKDEDDLPLEETRLVKRFRALAQSRQDIQPNGIVHDIVDPSLHSRILDPEEHAGVLQKKKRRNKISGPTFEKKEKILRNTWRIVKRPDSMQRKELTTKLSNESEAFQWVQR